MHAHDGDLASKYSTKSSYVLTGSPDAVFRRGKHRPYTQQGTTAKGFPNESAKSTMGSVACALTQGKDGIRGVGVSWYITCEACS